MITATLLSAFAPQLFSLVATLGTGFVLPKLYQWLHIQNSDAARTYLETALTNGLKLGFDKLTGATPTQADLLKVKDAAIDFAVTYVKAGVPDALKLLKITDDHLKSLLEARIPEIVDSIASVLK